MLARRMRLAIRIVLGFVALLIGGCGTHAHGHAEQPATLVLDFTPNAIHAGIYSAIARGFDRQQGVRLRILAPSASTDSVKLLTSGRADFAILDIHDLALARERGSDVVGIMAIVERPLAALIASPQISNPRLLQGRTVGVTGVPSDTAVLESIVAGAGGRPHAVKTIGIGFNAVAALLSGRVAAATAFWNDEGVTIRRNRPGFHIFRVDGFGAPSYPELVLCTTSATLRRDPAVVRGVVGALERGYSVTLTDPAASERDLESGVQGLDRKLVAAELRAVEPSLTGAGHRFGVLDQGTLRAWARWEVRFGIVHRPPDLARTFDLSLAGGSRSGGA
jgi:putative hydroxymethylpyrimidine transport system substrate-binding protein